MRAEDGSVTAIVEDSALSPDQRGINEINSSIYAFTLAKLWPCLARLRPSNIHRELYLTDAIGMLRQQGELVVAQLAADADEVLGCNTRADLSAHIETLRGQLAGAEARAGEEAAKTAQAIAALQSLAERIETLAEARRPWWRRLVG